MRNRILLAALLAGILGAVAWLVAGRGELEPVFQGKRLTAWLEDFDRWDQTDTNAPVVLAIRALGTNAVPTVVRMSLWRDSRLKERVGIEFEKYPKLMQYRYTIAARRWQRACQALSVMGEPTRGAGRCKTNTRLARRLLHLKGFSSGQKRQQIPVHSPRPTEWCKSPSKKRFRIG